LNETFELTAALCASFANSHSSNFYSAAVVVF